MSEGSVPLVIRGENGINVREAGIVYVGIGVPGANLVPNWWIDPVAGNDANDGLGAASPLKTFERLVQIIGDQVINQNTTIHLVNDFPTSNPVRIPFTRGSSGFITIKSEKPLTILYSGSFTAVSPTVTATNTQISVTDAALPADWGASGLLNTNNPTNIFRRIRVTSGAAAGATAHPVRDINPGTRTARTGPFIKAVQSLPDTNPPPQPLTPLVGDTFVVESGLLEIADLTVEMRSSAVLPSNGNSAGVLFIGISTASLGAAQVRRPPISMIGVEGSPPLILASECDCWGWQGFGQGFGALSSKLGANNNFFVNQAAQLIVTGGICVANLNTEARLIVHSGTLFELGGRLTSESPFVSLEVAGFFNSASQGILVRPGRAVQGQTFPFVTASAVYGAANLNGMIIQESAAYTWQGAASKPTITGTATELQVGGTSTTWASFGNNFTNLVTLATASLRA